MSDFAERFWKKVQKGPECWLWVGSKHRHGYGVMRISGGGKTGLPQKTNKAHRLAWSLTHGPVPVGMSVLHRCDVRNCCNPEHLFLGTQADNVADMYAKGRANNVGAVGERVWSAKLTAAQVIEIRKRTSSIALAEEYGISYRHMRQIQSGVRWKHLLEAE
jgi:hypothetical protein